MMKALRRLFRWWLDGLKILVYCLALYIVVSILLALPVYLWGVGMIGRGYDVVALVVYVGVYLPLVFRGAAAYLGEFPTDAALRGKPKEHTPIADGNSQQNA